MAGLSTSSSLSTISPQMREREDFFSTQTIKEHNTYSTWDEMNLPNDVTNIRFDDESEEVKELPADQFGYGIKSIFNKWTLVPVLSNEIRMKLNAPLVDTVNTRRQMKERSNPSIKNLVEQSRAGVLGRETYDYSDFMYCKYLGKMPNNYLVTLRRFPIACNDYIGQLADPDEEREIAVSLGCMVTWMGTPGNDMDNILSYSVKMPFKEVDAKVEDVQKNDNATPLGSMFAAFDSKYQQQVQQGMASQAVAPFMEKLGVPWGNAPYPDQLTWRDSNKVYGPIDVVKKTSMRSEDGLSFEHTFNLRFEYELRSYSNINARQAMLDLLANILTVTYVNGSFWRGGYRGLGPHQSDIFSNLKVMSSEGGVSGFIDAFANDLNTVSNSIKKEFKGKNILETLKNIANSFGGMLLGGMLNKLGRPQKNVVNSLLSPAPVGLWHVTVGNPFHPIMSIGNLVLENTKITHQGPLGLDDFPTKLVVDCTLKRAKGRDSNEIERLYNMGASRIYSGLEKYTIDLIKTAPKYNTNVDEIKKSLGLDPEEVKDLANNPSKLTAKIKQSYNKNTKSYGFKGFSTTQIATANGLDTIAMKRYWHTHDQDAILLAGKEWLRGGGSKNNPSNMNHPVVTR